MGADFTVQLLLNRSEARVLKELDRIVLSLKPGWQVMAQVSLGEILRCKDPEAYRCINSKRVDLLLVDENCQPRHALECQGGGHHQGTAAERDAGQERGSATSQHRPPRSGFGAHNTLGLKRSADSFHDWHLGFFLGNDTAPVETAIKTSFNGVVLCRQLAKIAHGHAVIDYGLRSFEPYLTDIVLGRDTSPETLSHLIGGERRGDQAAAGQTVVCLLCRAELQAAIY